jgi:hypothetical protein
MPASRCAATLAMTLRVAVLTLPVLLLFTATVLPLALLLTWVPGASAGVADNLLLAELCGLVVWMFLAIFHIRTETVRLPVNDRRQFVLRLIPILEELGYEVVRQGDSRLVSRPGFRALLLGGSVRVQVEGDTARVTGPKLFVEILRRRLRLQSYIDRAQQPARENRQPPSERLLKRVEIRLRLGATDASVLQEDILPALAREGVEVICEVNLLAQSEAGIPETAIEDLREKLRERGLAAEIRKDLPQWDVTAASPEPVPAARQ